MMTGPQHSADAAAVEPDPAMIAMCDEFASAAFNLRWASKGPGISGNVSDSLASAAAALDQIGRIVYAVATDDETPEPRIANPGRYAHAVYGPDADPSGPHYRCTSALLLQRSAVNIGPSVEHRTAEYAGIDPGEQLR